MSQEKSKLNLYIYIFLNAVDLKREKKSFWKQKVKLSALYNEIHYSTQHILANALNLTKKKKKKETKYTLKTNQDP